MNLAPRRYLRVFPVLVCHSYGSCILAVNIACYVPPGPDEVLYTLPIPKLFIKLFIWNLFNKVYVQIPWAIIIMIYSWGPVGLEAYYGCISFRFSSISVIIPSDLPNKSIRDLVPKKTSDKNSVATFTPIRSLKGFSEIICQCCNFLLWQRTRVHPSLGMIIWIGYTSYIFGFVTCKL